MLRILPISLFFLFDIILSLVIINKRVNTLAEIYLCGLWKFWLCFVMYFRFFFVFVTKFKEKNHLLDTKNTLIIFNSIIFGRKLSLVSNKIQQKYMPCFHIDRLNIWGLNILIKNSVRLLILILCLLNIKSNARVNIKNWI